MAVNKVVYGNDTLIDLTSDTVTSATMLNGTTAHDASGASITGSYVPPATPTSLTPSNSSPATITSGETYTATANGKAVASITNIIPLNSSPVRLAGFTPYVINSGSSTEVQGYAIESYSAYTPSTTNRSNSRLNIGSIYKIGVRYGYLYGAIPTGRNLFSYTTQPNRDSTSWYTVGFSSASTTVIDGSATVMLDERFAHFADGGEIVVDRDISTAYLAGYAWYGRTSSGTAVYSGVRVLKNGTVITGASASGSSSTTSPSFKQIETSFAVGDVIKIQTKVSSTSSANHKITVNICTP